MDIADRSMPFSGEKDSARTPVGQYATSKQHYVKADLEQVLNITSVVLSCGL